MANASLHLFAACSAEDATGWRAERFQRFERTVHVWGLHFACVGRLQRWQGFDRMAASYAAAAEGLPSRAKVAFIDSADAFVQASADEALAAFRLVAKGRPLVLGLETGCPPKRCTAAKLGRRMGSAGPAGIPWLTYVNGGFAHSLASARENRYCEQTCVGNGAGYDEGVECCTASGVMMMMI